MRWKKDKKEPIELDDIKLLQEQSPNKSWVNMLLMYMFKSNIDSFTLKKSQGIPDITMDDDDLSDGELDFEKIINRLKIMAGLDPVQYNEPRSGEITVFFGCKKKYIFKTEFTHSKDDQICELHLVKGS